MIDAVICVVAFVLLGISLPECPALAWLLMWQAGGFLSALAQCLATGPAATLRASSTALVPIVGLLDRPKVVGPHDGPAEKAGFVAEGVLYVALGIHAYGLYSVKGWPLAVLSLLFTLLLRPWM